MKWYKQDCDIFDRSWAKDAKMVSVYLYLHCHAYVRDGRLYGQIVRRGTCPTTRAEIEESTGLKESEVKLRLKMLKDCGEIIVKPSNRGIFVTLCDYDGYTDSEDLFGLNLPTQVTTQTPPQTPPQVTTQTPPYIDNNIEYIDNKNLRSNNIPSKIERENSKSLIYEIKDLYNKKFFGQLIAWKRLSEKMTIKVETCIQRFGRQSVDMVFDQVAHEPFSLGDNQTGFKADFDFIFRIDQFEKYLERYKLRIQKVSKAETTATPAEAKSSESPYRQEETMTAIEDRRKSFLVGWVNSEAKSPTLRGHELLLSCYKSGELQKLGIQWQPSDYIQQ